MSTPTPTPMDLSPEIVLLTKQPTIAHWGVHSSIGSHERNSDMTKTTQFLQGRDLLLSPGYSLF